jgi:tetratricopeptide (TPR) repeat protein
MIISWGVVDIAGRMRVRKEFLAILATIVLAILALITWRQAAVWKDDITLYTHGVRINPDNFVAQVNLGETYSNLNRPSEAIPHLLAALKIHENDTVAWSSLGKIYKKSKDWDRAINCYNQVLKHDPRSSAAHYTLGEIYAEQGLLDKAFMEFREVIRLSPMDAGANYNLGVIAAKKGNMVDGLKYLIHAVEARPKDVDFRLALGMLLMNAGRASEAAAQFREVLRLNPDSQDAKAGLNEAENYKGKGVSLRGNEQEDSAPDQKSLYQAAVELSSRGEYAKALNVLLKLRDHQPNNPDVYYNIACIYARQNKVEESVSWLRKALEKGFKDRILISGDKDLDNIRGSKGYQELISQKKG